MSTFTCKICGKSFERIGNGVYCPGPHYRPCPVCGKPVPFNRPSDPYKCCSKQCTVTLRKSTMVSRFQEQPCPECGKLFIRNNPGQVYCTGPHKSLCTICGKEFEYTCSPNEKPQTCSKACKEQLRSRTTNQNYGVSNVSELDWVRQKISEANKSPEVKAKREATCLRTRGVTNVAKDPEIKSKIKEIVSSKNFLDNREASCMGKYGFKSPSMHPDVKAKRLNTYYKNYPQGRRFTEADYAKRILDPNKASEYAAFKEDPAQYMLEHFDHKPNIQELRDALGVTDTPIYDILVACNCSNLLSKSYSWIETEVFEYLKSIVPNTTIIRNNRSIIAPYEIDIFLPEYNFGIECNPAFTHNSSVARFQGDDPKPYRYHQNKSKACKDVGVFLFHIFGYEWIAKKDIIKSMLSNILHANSERYGARETYVADVSIADCRKFLDDNHRQGYTNSIVRLGLRLKSTDELVSVMTFGHIRKTMGTNGQESTTTWELSRFCTRKGCNVAGGANKLFQYFLKHNDAKKIISFSDFAHTRGALYSSLGFQQKHLTEPGYVWASEDDSKYYHRVSCQKQFLKALLKDDSIDIEHNTEKEIMESHGYVRVYDSGVIRWEYVT